MRLYCPDPLETVPLYEAFYFKYPNLAPPQGLFKERAPANYFEKEVTYVSLEEARAIVLANNFTAETPEAEQYIKRYADEAAKLGIPIYIFSCGDFTDRLSFDERVQVFRVSIYRSTKRKQDICIPTLTEDWGSGIMLRSKQLPPIVSFCGQAGYATFKQWVKYYLKTAFGLMESILLPTTRARLIGVYWRRRMLSACKHSNMVRTLFVERHSFSGARRTIELDPAIARKEFVDSIINADFVLAPKGDGNYSNRFLEALNFGRIPVLLNTDSVLPFEDEIDYEKVMVTVPMQEVGKTATYIREWYDKLSDEEWQERQQLARHTFETYLRHDSFFRHFFSKILHE